MIEGTTGSGKKLGQNIRDVLVISQSNQDGEAKEEVDTSKTSPSKREKPNNKGGGGTGTRRQL